MTIRNWLRRFSGNRVKAVRSRARRPVQYRTLVERLEDRLAPAISYVVPNLPTPGNQAFGGSLGMDFDVITPVTITQLGVFDDNADGLSAFTIITPLSVRLFDRATQTQVGPTVTFDALSPGVLNGSSRFKSIAPFTLPAGFQGTIEADGFSAFDQNGNTGGAATTPGVLPFPWSTDSGGGLINFVGGGRNSNTPGVFPTSVDGGPANRYAAGTFAFNFATPTISIDDVSMAEGNAGTTIFTFTVTLSSISGTTVTAAYTTSDGAATLADNDYVQETGLLTFVPGDTEETITIEVVGDNKFELDETFFVDLLSPSGAIPGDVQGMGTIQNDDAVPTLSVSDATASEGGSADFTFTLSNATDQTVTVRVNTTGGTATANVDYNNIDSFFDVVFAPNTTTQTLAVPTFSDTTDEPDETFQLNVLSATNAFVADGQAIGAIIDDDPAPVVSIEDVTLAEGNAGPTTFTFNVTLSNPSSQTVTVTYATDNGSATVADNDYVFETGMVTFAPGVTTQSITVEVVGDTKFEPNEFFVVNLTAPVNAIISDPQGQGNITNDDTQPTASINDVTMTEGDVGTTAFVFTVTLSNASATPITIDFATQNGTATVADLDYVPNAGTLTFAPGTTTQTITVLVNGDTKFEINFPDFFETFFVNLSNPVGTTFTDAQGMGTITNDDPIPTVSIDDVTMTEGNAGTTAFVFTVTLTNPSSQAITIPYTTDDGTATVADGDYVDNDGSITFAPNTTTQTITVLVNGDNKFETDETFTVTLNPGAGVLSGDTTGVGTITNDDAQPAVTVSDASATEGSPVEFTLTLSNSSDQPVTVRVNTTGGTATANVDYDNIDSFFDVVFAPNTTTQTLAVPTFSDTIDEPDETFQLNVLSATNAFVADGQAIGVIIDDDPVPTVTIDDVTLAEGNAGTTAFTFTVTLSNPSSQAITITYTTNDGTATVADGDYVDNDGSVIFAPGATTQTITVLVNGDTKPEPDETFTVVLVMGSPPGSVVGGVKTTGIGTIVNDDIEADLQVTKTDSPDPVIAGQNITYTVTVTNNGPADAVNPTLTDTLPAGTTFVSFTSPAGWISTTPPVGGTGAVSTTATTLAAGATATFTLVVNVNSSVLQGSSITNTATVFNSLADPVLANNQAMQTTSVIAQADLSVTKTDSPDPVIAGQNLTYTITVSNTGPSDAQGVMLSDLVPTNTTFVSAMQTSGPSFTLATPPPGGTGTFSATATTLAAGATATFTFVVNVNANTPQGAAITNVASVTSTTTDPIAANNTDSEPTQVLTLADIQVTKIDSPDPVIAGTNLTYTISVSNAGPSDAQTVILSDALPANTTFVSATQTSGPAFTLFSPSPGGTGTFGAIIGTLAAGASATFTLVVNVNASSADGSTISNTFSASTTTTDPNAGNNTSTATTTVITQADLSVTKTDAPDPVIAGTNLTYTLTVSNAGPSDAQTVTLTDLIPTNTTFVSALQTSGPAFTLTTPPVGGTGAFSANAATLAAGASAAFTFVVNVNANVPNGGTITNTATVGSTTIDPNATDNTANESTAVIAQADLAVTKTDNPDPVNAGDNLTYTITVTNGGPSDSQNVALSDAVPGGTTFVSMTQTSGPAFTLSTPAVGGTGTMSASVGTLAASASATFTIVVHVNSFLANNTLVVNSATVSSTTADPVPANNSASTSTTVRHVQFLAVGAAAGRNPRVKVFAPNGVLAASFLAFDASFQGGVRVALGDVNHDGTTDVIVAAGPGNTPRVRVVDGTKLATLPSSGALPATAILADFLAYLPTFKGGVYVAAGDVNGDGRADIITGKGAGGEPRVKVVDATLLHNLAPDGRIANTALLANFLAYLPGFTGGVTVAAGFVNGDAKADIITGVASGPTTGIGPRVKIADATRLDQKLSDGRIAFNSLLGSFLAYNPSYPGGVRVAAGDVNGDGKADVITGPGAGIVSRMKAVDATRLDQVDADHRISQSALLASVIVFEQSFLDGINVGSIDFDSDGLAELLAGTGPTKRRVSAFDPLTRAFEFDLPLNFDAASVAGL